MKIQKSLKNFYLLEDIIPAIKKTTFLLKLSILATNKAMNRMYFFEDIIPFLKYLFKSSNWLFKQIKKGYGKGRTKLTELFLFLTYYPKNYKANKQRLENVDGIKIEKYANISRMLHEAKFGIKNTDYNALVIDWTLLAKTQAGRIKRKQIREKFSRKAIQSTYSYELNQRITY